ncbi:hypothetical protein HELRODRAFT_111705 [Helobdella robusta]|uniref:PCI domain-containing protein n=1 Tax=Helobdella robusta TaxID=6412 RepID=T1EFD9_HELRO|nr:hypothetical protein HELRODRAFT_111705 [Helobdella robusta]ESO04695.1 hypothetical protein HELRODRAFT_111705 [Helobdella robusta]
MMSQVQVYDFAGQNAGFVEPMQIDIVGEEPQQASDQNRRIIETSNLDLEQVASSYKGLAKIYRLLHIAEYCTSLKIEALRLALTHVLTTCNTQMYQTIHRMLQEAVGSQSRPADPANVGSAPVQQLVPPFDAVWLESTNKKAAMKLEKLDIDLKNYKSNSIKESIRRGHDDLGDHYLECGDLCNALKCYSRARDYCTSSKNIVYMCFNVIKVSIYLQNWSHVTSYVNKAESTPYFCEISKESNQQVVTKLKVSAGLADLVLGRYKNAAKNFLQANFDQVDFPELLSSNNIATYGALCALATFDRQELQKLVISSSTFKLFLELELQLRDIIYQFYDSKYALCLKLLDNIKDNLLLDMYLAKHVDNLYAQIRNRALCQYFSPYKSADMRKMAEAFNTTVSGLEDELTKLILDGKINARIDSHNKVLYAKDIDQRSLTFDKCFALEEEFQRKTKALILRAAVVKSQIQVKSPPRETNQASEISIMPGNATTAIIRN